MTRRGTYIVVAVRLATYRVSPFVVGLASIEYDASLGNQPKLRTGRDCLAAHETEHRSACVRTFARNTADALAPLLLRPHSQSSALVVCCNEAGTTPRLPRTFPD